MNLPDMDRKSASRIHPRVVQRVVFATTLFCLFFSITNYLPFSGAMIVFAPLIFLLFLTRDIHPSLVPSVLMLAFFIVSTALYDVQSLLSFDFYRRDGNVFVTYAPVLLLGMLDLRIDVHRIFVRFVKYATAINFINIFLWITVRRTFTEENHNHYPFLFEAHNATGGFLALLTAFSLALYVKRKQKIWLLLFSINLVGTVLSDSRGSILAVFVAILLVALPGRSLRIFIVLAAVVVNLAVVGWIYSIVDIDKVLTENIFTTEIINTGSVPRLITIVNRLFDLWPTALHHFFLSPILGTGFGSYDDTPAVFGGIRGLLMWKEAFVIEHSSGHAHHSFLNVLAETGLVGFFLLLASLNGMLRFIEGMSDTPLRLGLHIAFWTAIVSSFTEHRLFTPSQMLPSMLLLGLAIAAQNFAPVRNRPGFAGGPDS